MLGFDLSCQMLSKNNCRGMPCRQCLVNAVTGQVNSEQNHLSGNAEWSQKVDATLSFDSGSNLHEIALNQSRARGMSMQFASSTWKSDPRLTSIVQVD